MNRLEGRTKEHVRGTQERIKLPPSPAHTYNNPAVNHLFVQTRVATIPLTGALVRVALAMPWQL